MALGEELAKKFLQQLENLKKEKGGNLLIGDIDGLFKHLKGTERDEIYKGIQDIAGKINSAKLEISSVDGESIKDASLELDAVVKHTERAANQIMDAAEKIQALASNLPKGGEEITEQVTKLFEACDFQDITGQRISKVVNVLIDIEESVNNLLGVLEGKLDVKVLKGKKKKRGNRPDEDLMNGPQLDKPSQDDIDKLFSQS